MLHRPQSTADALKMLGMEGATILAGGTDIFPAYVDRPPPTALIDITKLPGLRGVSVDDATIRIGAATTWTDIVRTSLPPAFDMLKQAALEVGAVQIQNRGTIGGNLCNASPAADGVPPLLALDAQVELASPRGVRVLALEDFLLGNRQTIRAADEIMTAVLVPNDLPAARSKFLKLGARRHLVISIVMVAAALEFGEHATIKTARIAVGSASAIAQRLRTLEQRLVGARASADVAGHVTEECLSPLTPIDDIRATAGYRLDAAAELVKRTLLHLCGTPA